MKKVFSSKMEQEFYDEQFMQDAARLIDSDLLQELETAQEQEVDEAWLRQVKNGTLKSIKAKRARHFAMHILQKIGKAVAIFLLTVCVLFGGIYVSVDAARETINNFLLGNRNSRNAIVLPVYWDSQDYVLIPIGWTCPVYPTWIPADYSLASSGTQLDQYWWLAYHPKETVKESVCIYIWDDSYAPSAPNIDVENYKTVSEFTLQNVPATLYYDEKNDSYTIIMVKDDLTIQVMGTISEEDICEIAEKMHF